jgi:hypothetical protein
MNGLFIEIAAPEAVVRYLLTVARCQQLRNVNYPPTLSGSSETPASVIWKHLSR